MDDKAHVRFVDPHAEGDGGADDLDFIAEECLLVARALVAVEAGMIRRRFDPRIAQGSGERLGRAARLGIDDAGLPRTIAHVFNHLRGGFRFGDDAIGQIRTIETRDENFRIAQFELRADIFPHARRGRGGKSKQRNAGKCFPHFAQAPVFRPEIVSPLADAVRLIHG